MNNLKCSKCKEPISMDTKFFLLSIKTRGDISSKGLDLKLCSFKCLEDVVNNPSIIITELL